MSNTVVLASGNVGKLRELQDALAGAGFTLKPQSEFGVSDAVEDKPTFIENALIKARHASAETGLPAIADDSGLVVPALHGAPGIYSARYSGLGDAGNNAKLLEAMSPFTGDERNAHYFCVLVFLQNAQDPAPIVVEGRWHGRIALLPRGTGGFGYDPLFEIPMLASTAAEISLEEKRARSHRGQAVIKLRDAIAS
jgi:XTP/dITP diphosphohydrolase